VRLAAGSRIHRSREQLFAEIGLIDGLLTPAGELTAFARRQVVPPGEVIRERAQKSGEEPVGATVLYGLRMLVRFGLALAGLVRLPSWPRANLVRKSGLPDRVRDA
jgi:hypothetical protein